MAEIGFTPMKIYGSSVPGNIPSPTRLSSTATGVEIAVNYADGKLFYKDVSGVVQTLADKNVRSQTMRSPIGYSSGKYYYGMTDISNTSSVVSFLMNTLYAIAFFVSDTVTFNSINLSNVLNTGGPNLMRLGVYRKKDGGDYPDSLVYDSGSVSTGPVGTRSVSMSLQLTPGYYFLVLFSNTNGVCRATTFQPNILINQLYGSASADAITYADVSTGYTASLTFGALPATFPAGTYVQTNLPRICLGT